MVDFLLGHRRHRLVATVGFCWLLSVSFLVEYSRSLSTAVVYVSTSRPSLSAACVTTSIDSIEIKNDVCPHYKWLIIGGGIHGVGIAARLVGAGKINVGAGISSHDPSDGGQLMLVDEHPTLLHSWKERTRATGMAFLRSSSGFHLDVPANGLREFAGDYHPSKAGTAAAIATKQQKQPSKKAQRKAKNHRNKGSNPGGAFVGSDYQRPALELFNDHCDLVVEKYGLDDYFFRGRVESIICPNNRNHKEAAPSKLVIRTGRSDDSKSTITTTVSADNIVLAVGNDDPLFPEWAADLVSNNSNSHKISHLLQISDNADGSRSGDDETDNAPNDEIGGPRVVAIIGGGISAVHKALQLTSVDNINNKKTKSGNASNSVVVHIISRHPIREQQFDTHQDWMMTDELAKLSLEKGGKGLTQRQTKFRSIKAPADRREVIKNERIPGTVPTYMTRSRGGLEEAIAEGKIHWHVAGVASATVAGDDESGDSAPRRYQVDLTNGNGITADEIILATGLGKQPPGHKIIHPLAEQACLPLSRCGYPVVDPSLQWKKCQSKRSSDNDDDHGNHLFKNSLGSTKIFVSGGLAELELGPSARNIAGARMAAERIAAAADPQR